MCVELKLKACWMNKEKLLKKVWCNVFTENKTKQIYEMRLFLILADI